jgi:hypothetical protein
MFRSDIIKDYYVIHFNFTDDIRKYFIYKYMRNRKLTTKQMWAMVRHDEYDLKIISEGKAIDIGQFNGIVSILNLPANRCHMLMTFNPIM